MLASKPNANGSGGYVAIERVTGTLHDRKLAVPVVPDSGTDELMGLTGTLKIIIEGGKHAYEFEYTLGEG